MAADGDDTRRPGKLMQRARQLGGAPRERDEPASRVVMPSDVLQGGDAPTQPTRDPNTAPIPRPRDSAAPHPPNLPSDPEVTEVGRLPPNPVTGRPAGGGLDVVPVGAPTVQIPDPSADEATQIRIEPEATVIHGPGKLPTRPASPPSPESEAPSEAATTREDAAASAAKSKARFATSDDLGIGSSNLDDEPLLKWIAIGLGLMVFVAVAFALVALLVVAMTR